MSMTEEEAFQVVARRRWEADYYASRRLRPYQSHLPTSSNHAAAPDFSSTLNGNEYRRPPSSSNHATPPDFLSALNGNEYSESSDLTIKCGTKSFAVHKVIVCPQSKYFRAACSKNFMEGQTGTLTFPENEAALLEQLLEFLYTSTYTYAPPNETSLPFHLNMFIMGDKYDVPNLRSLATQRFEWSLQTTSRMGAIIEIIPAVYETIAAVEIRDAVLRFAMSWPRRFIAEGGTLTDGFRQVLRDVPDFAVDFVEKLVERV